MNALPDVLQPLADPNVAFLLFVVGALLVTITFVHPNLITGILGALALVLAFVGFASLPLNVAGLLLLVLGFVLFVLETQIVSHGLLTLGGIVAIVAGASILFAVDPPANPPVAVAPVVIIAVAGTVGLVMVFIVAAAVRSRRMKASPGTVGTVAAPGSAGVVQAPLAPLGTVYLGGETWSARTPDERVVPRDTPVRLLEFDGLIAVVEPDLIEDRHDAPPDAGRVRPPVVAGP
jgi:membrane-bound serine protease (ClpP class)